LSYLTTRNWPSGSGSSGTPRSTWSASGCPSGSRKPGWPRSLVPTPSGSPCTSPVRPRSPPKAATQLLAALSATTVVVEAGLRSRPLAAAAAAGGLGHPVWRRRI